MPRQGGSGGIRRRTVLAGSLAVGAGLARLRAEGTATQPAPVSVGLVGMGWHGRQLMYDILRAEGVTLTALCEIAPRLLRYGVRCGRAYKHDTKGYDDFDTMLAASKSLDAVVLATPDWLHARQTIAALSASLHVYCESPMACRLADASAMVLAARKHGKLLQVGLQRRSDPHYRQTLQFVRKNKVLGRLTHASAHWHTPVRPRRVSRWWSGIDSSVLKRAGYGTADRLMNWREHAQYAVSPAVRYGCHQVDVLNWALGAPPQAVLAAGYAYDPRRGSLADHVDAVYQWYLPAADKPLVLGTYQVLSATSHGSNAEEIIGNEGSLVLSQSTRMGVGLRREDQAPEQPWERTPEMIRRRRKFLGLTREGDADWRAPSLGLLPGEVQRVRPSFCSQESYGDRIFPLPVADDCPRSQWSWHLENFFAAVRVPMEIELNCPGEVGYEALASVLPLDAAMAKRAEIQLAPESFRV